MNKYIKQLMSIGCDISHKPTQTSILLSNPPAAWVDVLVERHRQVAGEGWEAAHDDSMTGEELALAAAIYAAPETSGEASPRDRILGLWPWLPKWFKPRSRRRDLVKAAALILAEIERLDRAEGRKP